MKRTVFKLFTALACLLLVGFLSLMFYVSSTGLRLRAQLGQQSGQYLYALDLYEKDRIGDALRAIQGPMSDGYEPALAVICGFVNGYQPVAPTPEGCVQTMKDTPYKRLSSLFETALWAFEWDVADQLLKDRLANDDQTAHFDRARFMVLARPEKLDIASLIAELQKANEVQDPRGQYAYIVASLNVSAEGALSPILAELLTRRPSLQPGDAYFELAKLIQSGAISSDLDYVEILSRADRLNNVYAAGYLAQYYLSNPDRDPNGAEQVKWLTKAAAQGDTVAQYNIALGIINDPAQSRPISDAVILLDRSASAGFVPALTLLGVTLWKDPTLQDGPEQEVRQRAITLLQSAAEQDDVNALFNLGSLFVSQNNPEQATVYLSRAAQLGSELAQAMLNEIGGAP